MFLCAHFKSVWAFMSSIKSIVNTKYLKHEISKNISNNSLSLKTKTSKLKMFLRAALKDETEIALLRELGRVFHNVGA